MHVITGAAQYGMGVCIFVGFILVLKWVFDINSKVLADVSEERRHNQEIMRGFAENIKENTQAAKDFKQQVDDAHKYQREEHKEMIVSLGRINGYSK